MADDMDVGAIEDDALNDDDEQDESYVPAEKCAKKAKKSNGCGFWAYTRTTAKRSAARTKKESNNRIE